MSLWSTTKHFAQAEEVFFANVHEGVDGFDGLHNFFVRGSRSVRLGWWRRLSGHIEDGWITPPFEGAVDDNRQQHHHNGIREHRKKNKPKTEVMNSTATHDRGKGCGPA